MASAVRSVVLACMAAFGAATSAGAANLEGDDDAKAWNAASVADRDRWVATAVTAINRRSLREYTRAEMRICLDAYFKPPVSREASEKTIGQAALGCVSKLRGGK